MALIYDGIIAQGTGIPADTDIPVGVEIPATTPLGTVWLTLQIQALGPWGTIGPRITNLGDIDETCYEPLDHLDFGALGATAAGGLFGNGAVGQFGAVPLRTVNPSSLLRFRNFLSPGSGTVNYVLRQFRGANGPTIGFNVVSPDQAVESPFPFPPTIAGAFTSDGQHYDETIPVYDASYVLASWWSWGFALDVGSRGGLCTGYFPICEPAGGVDPGTPSLGFDVVTWDGAAYNPSRGVAGYWHFSSAVDICSPPIYEVSLDWNNFGSCIPCTIFFGPGPAVSRNQHLSGVMLVSAKGGAAPACTLTRPTKFSIRREGLTRLGVT